MSEQKNRPDAAAIAAHIISDLFSPLLAPTYAMIVAMWLTRMHFLPLSIRLWSTLGVTAITALVPVTFIAILIKRGKVSDTSISNPAQRTAPYCAAIICYILAGAYMFALSAPLWLIAFFAGAALVSLISLIITHWWKISAHTGGVAGLAAVVYWLGLNGYLESSPLGWISASLALVGIMAWARLYLNHHTLMQTAAGAALSFGTVYGMMCLLH